MKLIQPGNAKLHNMYMWNMPATKLQCGRICPGCYARREETRWPSVRKAREARYQASLQPDFSSRIIAELKALRKPPKYFRVHASSEFYSQSYIDSWITIAKSFPDITFFSYTKRLRDFDFKILQTLPNFILIDSLHFGKLNFSALSNAPQTAFICPDQKGAAVQCGISCTWCMTKGKADVNGVWFIAH